jgi:hypothetical protein
MRRRLSLRGQFRAAILAGKPLAAALLARTGYRLVNVKTGGGARIVVDFRDIERDQLFLELSRRCHPFTLSTLERQFALYAAASYVASSGVDGEFVECGVWRGGSSMLMAHTLLATGQVPSRRLYLYDTFTGMSAPTAYDRDIDGVSAQDLLQEGAPEMLCDVPLDEVVRNLRSTGYPERLLTFVKGKVEDTIPGTIPDRIALLRLDTDFYESTYHELVHLFPRLARGGVLVLDDYGHWQGARQAIDQYLAETGSALLLCRIDYTGRIAVKL